MTQKVVENTTQISIDNFHEIVEGIHSKEEALVILKWTNNFLRETFEQASNNAEVLNIVEASLALLRRLNLTEGYHHLDLINRLGLMCHLNGNYNQAISFYLLGLLQSNAQKRPIFNHNIGDAMLSLGNLDDALHYLNLAIESRTLLEEVTLIGAEESNFIDKMYYFICLLLADKMEEATLVFEDVKNLKSNIGSYKHVASTAKMIWYFKTGDEERGVAYYNEAKELLKEFEAYSIDTYEHNINYLKFCPNMDNETKEKVILECIEIAQGKLQNSFVRNAYMKLIALYEEIGEEAKKIEYLLKLYEYEKNEKEELHPRLNTILINEFNTFFNEINTVNSLINKQKDELQDITYILSHDLKTPMRTINSFSSLIERKIEKNDFQDIGQDFQFLRKATSNIYHLIEDIGELNMVNTDEGPDESIDMNEILLEVRDGISSLLRSKNAQIEKETTLESIKGKHSDFRILFQNIIENGIKYNESDLPAIKIRARTEERNYIISFEDNGIGFDSSYSDQIFGFFKRLHSDQKYEGTGFGLGICRKIMNKYEGEILVESKVGHGSSFDLLFPVKLLTNN